MNLWSWLPFYRPSLKELVGDQWKKEDPLMPLEKLKDYENIYLSMLVMELTKWMIEERQNKQVPKSKFVSQDESTIVTNLVTEDDFRIMIWKDASKILEERKSSK